MPSLPVFGDVFGDQRGFEVLGKFDAKHLGNTHDHIDTTGEIGVDLEAVDNQRIQDHDAMGVFGLQDAHDQNADAVSNHDFL